MTTLSHEQRRVRREEIALAAQQGMYKEHIMMKFDVSSTTVKTACRNAGVPLNKHPAGIEEKCFRFLRLVKNGVSNEAAASHLGINEETQKRICSAARLAGFL